MPIKTTIHSIDVKTKSATISIVDDQHIVLDNKNVCPVELNSDGTANTEWFVLYSKYFTFHDRLVRLDKSEDDLL